MAFTTQDEVPSVRISHLEQRTFTRNANIKEDDEIENLNSIIKKLELRDNEQLQKENIESYINSINTCFNKKIKNWKSKELNNWSEKYAGKLSKHFGGQALYENDIVYAIAVMDRANEIATGGHRLRDRQKIAILIFMGTNERGHISQINTGEGKTTIISVIAALKVMQGYKVHVITSNNVLAAEGVKDKSSFYSLLNITVADNNPDEKYTDGPRSCYSRHIVYGSITSFQFDWLRDTFEELKTLGGIDYSNVWVLLNEIDSLLIDQGSNIAKLSGPFPGMESLRYIYINIWAALVKTEGIVAYEILEKKKEKAIELNENNAMDDEEKQLEYEEYENTLIESYLDEVKRHILEHKDDLINKDITAHHLHQYAEDSLDRWIEHAFAATHQYQENVEYKIVEDKNGKDKNGKVKRGENIIIPVDNHNTGVSMKNTIFSNGSHQFLQIKHNLCLTYESLTSCYVSNLEYIKKYGSKLSVVTGTLGSTSEQNLLGPVFNLSFSIIPPFKSKMFAQYPGRISTDVHFFNDVAKAALREVKRIQLELSQDENKKDNMTFFSRAVLIVCASILDVKMIKKEVLNTAKSAGLRPCVSIFADENDAHITETTIEPNTIVIATNLAGRGTDFKTSADLEQNGGLHVIEAFLPCNQRVQDQGFGRTSRQGNNGTGQIIARRSEVKALFEPLRNAGNITEMEMIQFDTIISTRDRLEEERINDIRENKIMELEFKGQLFNKFAEEYGKLKEKHKTGGRTDVIKWMYVLMDLKEKWAFWLEKKVYSITKIKEIILDEKLMFPECDDLQLIKKAVDKDYKMFLNESRQILEGSIHHNPYYSICLADKYLENRLDMEAREKAKSKLMHALEISHSSGLLYSAYMKLFEIAIDDGGKFGNVLNKTTGKFIPLESEKNCKKYKNYAKKYLEEAKIAIGKEYDYLETLIIGKNGANNVQGSALLSTIINPAGVADLKSNLFLKNFQSRLVCLGGFKRNIESLILQINANKKDDLVIACKATNYHSKCELEDDITKNSVEEFEFVGMSSVYELGKISKVQEKDIKDAQTQIGSACALLTKGADTPFSSEVLESLAGALVSETATDTITGLIQQGQTELDEKEKQSEFVVKEGQTELDEKEKHSEFVVKEGQS